MGAAGCSAWLGALFLVVYGGINWLTSLRSDVGTLHFAWERRLPFVPILLVPYMSLDLFFAAAPFLCRTRAEVHGLAKRIAFAIAVSGACFLLLPLRLGFERPVVPGPLGALYEALPGIIGQYNLFPSLHIGLLGIIWPVYRRRASAGRLALDTWFLLIGASTVLTYQHHLVDVAGGVLVALLALSLVPDPTAEGRDPQADTAPPRNWGRATAYSLLALATGSLAYILRPWGLVLAWPAVAFAVVTAAYLGLGPRVFRKTEGRLPLGTRLLLGPFLLGTAVWMRRYRRRLSPWTEVAPGVVVGRRLGEREAEDAVRRGVRAVLDLTAEYSAPAAFRRLPYRNLPVLDFTPPSPGQLAEAVAFIQHHRHAGTVYVHCALGCSRSACVAAAWFLAVGLVSTADSAIARVRTARPETVIGPSLVAALRAYRPAAPAGARCGGALS